MTLSDAPVEHYAINQSSSAVAATPPLRLAVSSIFGDPLDPATWSSAPYNLARELQALGVEISSVHPRTPFRQEVWDAFHMLVTSGRRPQNHEALMRAQIPRARRAAAVSAAARRLGVDGVLHTGTLDLPKRGNDGVDHYLYCDHTWDLTLRYRPEAGPPDTARNRDYDDLERASYASARHIFTFGRYVRDNLIDHYGIAPDRVTAVGSGMGRIRPFDGPKDYAHGPLLFIAKHMFVEKGGLLALKALKLARRRRPDLRLIIVGNDRWKGLVGEDTGVRVLGHVPWVTLEELIRSAAVLLQPMFNDPWGQVYLEALISRTPIIGLARNGLPEISEGGRHGFMVDIPDPAVLADTIVDAVSDPDRLARMGESGQRHVLENYSWARVARAISEAIGSLRPTESAPSL